MVADRRLRMVMDEVRFEELVGHAPIRDDLERSNCKLHSATEHTFCGVCTKHGAPRFAGHVRCDE